MKVPVPAQQAPVQDFQMPSNEPIEPSNNELPQEPVEDDENIFGKEKFDAGVGDEDADPKKYIEKLTGKLAQKLRDYNGTEQDVDLNKFVVNSLIPAAVPQMDETDAKDVIKKVQDNIGKSGQDGEPEQSDSFDSEGSTEQPSVEDSPEQGGLPPVQQESNDNEVNDLINEILKGKSVRKNVQHKNPFKSPRFK